MAGAGVLPKASVVIPARNAARFIAATLESLRAQETGDFEAIVIDDGSSDATAEIVRGVAAQDPRFRLLAGEAKGVSSARNAGLNAAEGEIVLFLDADDLLRPDALGRFAEALASVPEAVAVLGGVARIAENGAPLPGRDNRELAAGEDQLADLLRKNFIVNGGALAIRRSAALEAGGYDPGLTYGEDWEFWCRLLELGPLAILPGSAVLEYRQIASGANYRARGSAFAWRVPCLERVARRPSLQKRYGARLARLVRARRIDIFWSGVRSEYQFGGRAKALLLAAAGLMLYPDSLARPRLILRFANSLRR
jgi:glycosyltransferase involved in cell wall biosynthesis